MSPKFRFKIAVALSLGIVSVLFAPAAVASDANSGVTRRTGLFEAIRGLVTGQPSETVEIHGGDDYYVSTQSDGSTHSTVYMGGAVAKAFVAGRAKPPSAPITVELTTDTRKLIGGMTEIIPESGILVTARHVLQGTSAATLEKAFRHNGLDLSNYAFYEFRAGGRNVDAVIAVPKGSESLIMERPLPKSGCACEPGVQQLRVLPGFESSPQIGDYYFSYQYGKVGDIGIQQISRGRISRAGLDRFYLDIDEDNFTTAGSSGSMVYTGSAKTLRTRGGIPEPEWKIGGIVECVVPPRVDRGGRPIPGGIQVISLSTLMDAEIRSVPLNQLSVEKPVFEENGCKKIGGGDAGGG